MASIKDYTKEDLEKAKEHLMKSMQFKFGEQKDLDVISVSVMAIQHRIDELSS